MTFPETPHNAPTGADTPPHDHENDTVVNNTRSQQLRRESPIRNLQQQLSPRWSSTAGGAGPSTSRPFVHCHCQCHEAVTMAEMKNKVVTVDDGGYLDSLPVGFRFVPTDDELLKYYLLKKIKNEYLPKTKISEADIYRNHPKDIVGNYPQATEDNWYFFTPRRNNRVRPARRAGSGYWKATGPDKVFKDDNGKKIGGKKSLVYYEGHSPHGTKTKWMMHEFTIKSPSHPNDNRRDNYVLCRIYIKARKKDEVATDHRQQSGVASLANLRVESEKPDVGPTGCHGTNNGVTQDHCDQNLNPATPDLVDIELSVVGYNRHISPATVPRQRAHTVSNQDVNPTSFRVENNIHHVGSNSSNLSSNEKGVKEGKRPAMAREPHAGMTPCWERIVRPRVGWHHCQNIKPSYDLTSPYFKSAHSFPTRFNYEYSMQRSYIAPTPQESRNERAPQGQARPVMHHFGSSSNPPPQEVAQHCQGGIGDDSINRLKRNIERMLELQDGYEHLLDDTLDKLLFDGDEDVDGDESNKHIHEAPKG